VTFIGSDITSKQTHTVRLIDLINMHVKFNWPDWYKIKGTNLINMKIY
jgi:hypothetical protein